jgi:hypothetical protein
MKRALFAIAGVGIVATAVGVEAANAQYSGSSSLYPSSSLRLSSKLSPLPRYTRGGPGYGYGPGPDPNSVIVNPVTGRWCRTEPNGYQWCWTP